MHPHSYYFLVCGRNLNLGSNPGLGGPFPLNVTTTPAVTSLSLFYTSTTGAVLDQLVGMTGLLYVSSPLPIVVVGN